MSDFSLLMHSDTILELFCLVDNGKQPVHKQQVQVKRGATSKQLPVVIISHNCSQSHNPTMSSFLNWWPLSQNLLRCMAFQHMPDDNQQLEIRWVSTVNPKIFVSKNFRGRNFRVKNFLDASVCPKLCKRLSEIINIDNF